MGGKLVSVWGILLKMAGILKKKVFFLRVVLTCLEACLNWFPLVRLRICGGKLVAFIGMIFWWILWKKIRSLKSRRYFNVWRLSLLRRLWYAGISIFGKQRRKIILEIRFWTDSMFFSADTEYELNEKDANSTSDLT